MRFDVFTLLPEMFPPYLGVSILQKAIEKSLIEVHVHDIRASTHDKHHITDDAPYGGGGGMVMKPEPIFESVESILGSPPCCPVIYLSPQGRPFTSEIARDFTRYEQVALLCGRYEGIDERVIEHLVTEQISIGDFVVTGGELPALMVIDAVSRFIPGVLGDPDGAMDDSFGDGLLEYPQYTRPENFRGWKVPPVLLSGNHAQIAEWRHEQSLIRTRRQRPDLLEKK
jgi:tRNA (guanine37-N1)-methyltransferase